MNQLDHIEGTSELADIGLYDCPHCGLKNQPGISFNDTPPQACCMACWINDLLRTHPVLEVGFDPEGRKTFTNLCMAQLYYQHQQSDIDFVHPVRELAKQQQGDN